MSTSRNFDSLVMDIFPSLNRTAIGFEPTLRRLYEINRTYDTYPPYNIVNLDETKYQLEIAVAGFSREEITITLQENYLVIKGEKPQTDTPTNYVHRGIANRAFTRKFEIGEHIYVKSANLENGVLLVDLERIVPESKLPRVIPIGDTLPVVDVTSNNRTAKIDNKSV